MEKIEVWKNNNHYFWQFYENPNNSRNNLKPRLTGEWDIFASSRFSAISPDVTHWLSPNFQFTPDDQFDTSLPKKISLAPIGRPHVTSGWRLVLRFWLQKKLREATSPRRNRLIFTKDGIWTCPSNLYLKCRTICKVGKINTKKYLQFFCQRKLSNQIALALYMKEHCLAHTS